MPGPNPGMAALTRNTTPAHCAVVRSPLRTKVKRPFNWCPAPKVGLDDTIRWRNNRLRGHGGHDADGRDSHVVCICVADITAQTHLVHVLDRLNDATHLHYSRRRRRRKARWCRIGTTQALPLGCRSSHQKPSKPWRHSAELGQRPTCKRRFKSALWTASSMSPCPGERRPCLPRTAVHA